MKVSSLKARIRTIRNSNIPASDKQFLIEKLNQVIKANKQIVEVLQK